MLTDDLDFHLPPELIAQEPTAERTASRLLAYDRGTRAVSHCQFADLPRLLRPGDLLVFNDTRVTPAQFFLLKPTGGVVEGLFLSAEGCRWRALLKAPGPVDPARIFTFARDPTVTCRVTAKLPKGGYELTVETDEPAEALLERLGRMPLPPYIRREKLADPRDETDRQRYQTVYAGVASAGASAGAAPGGSVAAPTAGLHFTDLLLEQLTSAGIRRAFVTLQVGMGTFKPVEADDVRQHAMHAERWHLPEAAAAAMNATKQAGGRVIAVGTTAARTLESQPPGPLQPGQGQTSIFIYPPYAWKHVDALITNFHLPRSTLIALVAAFVGLDPQRHLYAEAIERRYRFFSYGDAMLLT